MTTIIFTDIVMVSTVLPTFQAHLLASYAELQWILNIYILTLAVFLITMGRFGDQFGDRTILFIGMIGFAVSTFFAGLAETPLWLITARGFQGFFAACCFPCILALLRYSFPEQMWGKAIGVWNGIAMLGFVIGPLLGSILVTFLNWRWIFFSTVPFTLLALIISASTLDKSFNKEHKASVDWWGFIFLTIGVSSFIVGLVQVTSWGWASPPTLILFVVTIISILLWILVEMTEKEPIINFRWFANRTFAGSVIAASCFSALVLGLLFLIPLYLKNICQCTYTHVGIIMLSITLPPVLLSPLFGHWVDKQGFRTPLALGLLCCLVSFILLTFLHVHASYAYLILALLLFGISWPLIIAPVKVGILETLPLKRSASGMGALLTFEYLGGAIGLSILGSIFRIGENHSLSKQLVASGVDLSKQDQLLLQALFGHPLRARQILQEYAGTIHQNVMPLFKKAFMVGLQHMIWTGVAISAVSFLVTLFLIRKRTK